MADIIDINITPVVEEITLTIVPNLTTINVNTISGGGGAVDSVNGLTGVVQIGLESVLNQSDRPIKDVSASTYTFIAEDRAKLITASEIANYTLNKNIFPIGTVLKVLPLSGDITILRGAGISLVSNGNSDKTVTSNTIALLTHLTGSGGADEYWTFNVIPISASSGVPYTGATSDVNLGEFGLLTGNLEFDNTPTNLPTNAGSVYYNDTDGTLDLILKGGNVKLQIGQEQVVRVVNKTATNINLLEANYQAVRVTGAQGQRMKVDLAQATNDLLSAETIGLVTETINNNQEGFITTSGLVRNINTTGSLQSETWADGDVVYLSPTIAGRLTKVKPLAPNHLVVMGYVIYAHATQGSIFVKVDNGYELDELHNVDIVTPLNNQGLVYETSTQIWKNKTIIEDAIVNGVTDKAPSQNVVFDSLVPKETNFHKTVTSSTAVTGTTSNTILTSALIPANTFTTGSYFRVMCNIQRVGANNGATYRMYVNTSNTISGATLLGTVINGTTNLFSPFSRVFPCRATNLVGCTTPTLNAVTDISGILNSAYTTQAFDFTVDNYIIIAVQASSTLDSFTSELLTVIGNK